MTLYVVLWDIASYDGDALIGVCTTEEKAEAMKREACARLGYNDLDSFHIAEIEANTHVSEHVVSTAG